MGELRMVSRYIFSGGPGSGKTTLIQLFKKEGYRCMPEAGRSIIQSQTAIGGSALPWVNPQLYAELMLSWELRSYDAAESNSVFYDRGIPDICAYLDTLGLPVPSYMHHAAIRYRYADTVFMFPPWKAIYVKDAERHQSFEMAVEIHEAMINVYTRYNYRIVHVPFGMVQERKAFVLAFIAQHQ